MNTLPKFITKRDGTKLSFQQEKITIAIKKAFLAIHQKCNICLTQVDEVTQGFSDIVVSKLPENPTVEFCQDTVEKVLMEQGAYEIARAYITYREEHAKRRKESGKVSEELQELAKLSSSYFPSIYNEIVYLRTYSRWLDDKGRREFWPETVDRFMDYMKWSLKSRGLSLISQKGNSTQAVSLELPKGSIMKLTGGDAIYARELKSKEEFGNPDGTNEKEEELYNEIQEAILNMEVMPSMRLLQFAGPPAIRDNVCAYNCCYIAIEKLEDFRDAMYILMQGCGVGFSVEEKYTNKLPWIEPARNFDFVETYVIPDSREGWTDSLEIGLRTWWQGGDIRFDYSKIRPCGTRLVVTGGFASGPAPLKTLLNFARNLIRGKALTGIKSRLSTLEVHDLICTVASVVVVGGVRRSSLISLFDLNDAAMRDCKKGEFWKSHPQRAMANNSAVYDIEPSDTVLLKQWQILQEGFSGEPGIFSRSSLLEQLPKRRIERIGKEALSHMGCNPCAEQRLLPKQFCNLSSVVCKHYDTKQTLKRKVKLATIIGTFQASLTNFKYIQPEFKRITEFESLLGVSLAAQQDCPVVRSSEVLSMLREHAIKVNEKYAKNLGIPSSTAITTVKPDGTLGAMTGCSSGVHPAFDNFFIRRVRMNNHDALAQLLKDQGIPNFPETGSTRDNSTTTVFEFPLRSSPNSVVRSQMSAIDMLEYCKLVKTQYTEHNPSVTINIRDNEWISALNWIRNNWKFVGSMAFLPYDNTLYPLAPFETLTQSEYDFKVSTFPKVNLSKLVYYEKEDTTDVKKEMACSGNQCDNL